MPNDIPYAPPDTPAVTTDQMREADRAMIEDYGIELIQMMENAGRVLAQLARQRFFAGDPRGKHVVVLAGTGGNGGGVLVAARRLHNYGANVQVFATAPIERFSPVPAHQHRILQQMGVSIHHASEVTAAPAADLVLDGIIGYSLSGAPRTDAATLIRWANAQPAPIAALDVPSGIDPTGGTVYDPAIRATATLTLALPKTGLLGASVANLVGELYVADISVPPALYAAITPSLDVGPLFATSDLLRLR